MSVYGLIKLTSYFNRVQQKRDWKLIVRMAEKDLQPPDWNKSVKKIDAYMEAICKEHNIDFKEICGVG